MKALYPSLIALALCACGQTEAPPAEAPAEPPAVEADAPVVETPAEPETITADLEPLDAVDANYDESWFVDYSWPGEYPSGISIMEDGVVIPARSTPDPDAEFDVSCPLEVGATLHQWNEARVTEDDLHFIAATETIAQNVTTAATLTVWPFESEAEEPVTLDIAPGDTITVIRYYGEGFGAMQMDGVNYQTDLMELYEYLEEDETYVDEHKWVLATCDDAESTRAWMRLDEALETEGTLDTLLTEYGVAEDIPQ